MAVHSLFLFIGVSLLLACNDVAGQFIHTNKARDWRKQSTRMMRGLTKSAFAPKLGWKTHLPSDKVTAFLDNPHAYERVPTERADIPYQVSIQIYKRGWRHLCSGSIIDELFILTAAHCVLDTDRYEVEAGLSNFDDRPSVSMDGRRSQISNAYQRTTVNQAVTHEDYDFDPNYGYVNDIALLKLHSPLNLQSSRVSKVELIGPQDSILDNNQTQATVSGWDLSPRKEDDRILHKLKLNLHTDSECEGIYSSSRYSINPSVQLCVGGFGQEACKGDLGGPLVVNGRVVGVSSWQDQDKGCAFYPAVYTKVQHFLKWIEKTKKIMLQLKP